MKKSIALLPGDGVGPEVTSQAVKVLEVIAQKFGHEFTFRHGLIGASAIHKTGNPLPEETLRLCQETDAILFGAIGDPKYDLDPQAKIRPEQGLLKLRKTLGLYVNLRPVKVFAPLINVSPLKREKIAEVDLLVVRELIGGIYFGERGRHDQGNTAFDTSIYKREDIERVAHVAFSQAMKRRKKVTSVDKANVLETSRLWREVVTDVAKLYPQVELTHLFVDNAAMQLIKNPKSFDVILTENMFGDILSDEASVLAGSIGLLPSASLGEKHALYEPIHGAFNKAAGQNLANPIGAILSSAMLLRISFGLEKEARIIEEVIEAALGKGIRTKDIGAKDGESQKILGTREFGDYLVKTLEENY